MSKRFIDTEIFSDPWFMDLSVNAKLFYIYLITNCNHAGIIEINWKLAELQTGIKQLAKSYVTLIKEYNNKLIKLRDRYYFIPKFIEFQYPGFPKSNVRQQESAIKILCEFDLFDTENLRLNKELANSYEDDSVSEDGNGSGNGSGKTEIILPWTEDEFYHVWEFWKKYKKEQHNFSYKPIGEQGALSKLQELSGGNLASALLIIKQSIQNGWKGFFDLKGDYKDQGYDIDEIIKKAKRNGDSKV